MPHEHDVAVGARTRELRIRAGLTQTGLAKALGVSFQQVQKYERGFNRMGASRLIQVAQALNVPVTALFEGIASTETDTRELALDKDASKVARDWANIPDEKSRETMRAVVHQLSRA